jgi:hypothetical protein
MGYHYYSCRRKRVTSDKRTRGLTCPKVKAEWLEELVWADVRSFLEEPREVLQRVREQFAEDLAGREASRSVTRPSRGAWRPSRARRAATSSSTRRGSWTMRSSRSSRC